MATNEKRYATSVRKYITFQNPNRSLHQNVNKSLDVRQWNFDGARVLDCRDGVGKVDHWGKGWLCVTIVQHSDLPMSSSGSPQGVMSLDITVGEEPVENMFYHGNIVNNKSVSSVVGNSVHPNGDCSAVLVTLVSEGNSLQITKVEHTLWGSGGHGGHGSAEDAPTDDRRRERTEKGHDDDRRKRFEVMNGAGHSRDRSGSAASVAASGGKQKERRRADEDCES